MLERDLPYLDGTLLIDDAGEAWTAAEFAAHLRAPGHGLLDYAVRELGYVLIRPQRKGTEVAFSAQRLGLRTLAGALLTLARLGSARILAAAFAGDAWSYRLCRGVAAFGAHAEALAAGQSHGEDAPWLAVERGLEDLAQPEFTPLWPLLEVWRANRGRLSDEVGAVLRRSGLYGRSVLVRQTAPSRLIVEHSGAAIGVQRPCEHLQWVGGPVENLPDRAYGAWAAESYTVALAGRRARFEHVRAAFRTSDARLCRAVYDRLLLPWQEADGDLRLLIVSRRRTLSVFR
jgi:hypothetical protein